MPRSLSTIPKRTDGIRSSNFSGVSASNQILVSDTQAKIFLAIMVLASLALKLLGLGDHPVWPDAGYTHVMTEQAYGQLLSKPLDSHPPAFYILTKFVYAFGEGEVWLRLSSVMLGTFCIISMFILGRHVSGNFGGLVVAMLTASSGMLDYHSQRARMYTLLFLALSVFVYASIRLIQSAADDRLSFQRSHTQLGNQVAAALYIVGGGIALYTHMIAAFFIAAVGLVSIPFVWGAYRDGKTHIVGTWVVANTILAALWLPWILSLKSVFGSGLVVWIEQPSILKAIAMVTNVNTGWVLPWPLDLVFLALIAVGVFTAFSQRRWRLLAVCFATGILFPAFMLLAGLFQPVFIERALIPSLIGTYLLLGFVVSNLNVPRLVTVGLVALLAGLQLASVQKARDWPPRQDWRLATEKLMADATDATAIIVPNRFSYHAFRFYAEPAPDRTFYAWSPTSETFYEFTDEAFSAEHGLTPAERASLPRSFSGFGPEISTLKVVGFYYDSWFKEFLREDLEAMGWEVTSTEVVRGRADLEITELRRAAYSPATH